MGKPAQLTYDQLETVVSRFKNSCYRLKQSGDYPEVDTDYEIFSILLEMKWEAKKEEIQEGRRAD